MIVDALDTYYREKNARDQRERRETHSGHKLGPSSLASCLRQQAFLLLGLEGLPPEPHTVRTWELGHQRGEALEEACKAIWPDAVSQVPVRIPLGRFEMKGTADLWIPSIRTVVDFKTQGAFGFGLLDKEGVSEDYALQVHAYRDAISAANKYGIDPASPNVIRGVVVYESKDADYRKSIKAGELRELEVPWTEELEERYQTRLRELEGLLIRREMGTLDPTTIPELPIVDGKRSWKCKETVCPVGVQRGGCYGGR